jgi:hypothetical protein
MTDFREELGRAFDASVPLVHVVSADPPAAIEAVAKVVTDLDPEALVYLASPLLGLEALSETAARRLGDLSGGQDPSMLRDSAALLEALVTLPVDEGAPARIVLWTGAERAWSEPGLAGALLLVRDRLPGRGVTLIGVGVGPVEGFLSAHVHTMRDELPGDAERVALASQVFSANGIPLGDREIALVRNQTRGLNRFAVRQVATLSTTTGVLDVRQLTARTRETLGSLPGVKVVDPLPLSAMGGSRAWIEHLSRYRASSPSLVVILDEMEKVVPTLGANDSGVSAAILGMLLDHLGTYKPIAAISMGVPGTGKTLSGLVAGSLYECPVIVIRPPEWKSTGVGESERNTRDALDAVAAFGGEQVWIATSNGLASVPKEMRSRFRSGVWYSDVPTYLEHAAIWKACLGRYGFDPLTPQPDLTGWTGRDVEGACLEARSSKRGVLDVVPEVVPTARMMAVEIEEMRTEARAKGYRSVDTGAPYAGPAAPATATAPAASRAARRRPAPEPAPVVDGGEDLF